MLSVDVKKSLRQIILSHDEVFKLDSFKYMKKAEMKKMMKLSAKTPQTSVDDMNPSNYASSP